MFQQEYGSEEENFGSSFHIFYFLEKTSKQKLWHKILKSIIKLIAVLLIKGLYTHRDSKNMFKLLFGLLSFEIKSMLLTVLDRSCSMMRNFVILFVASQILIQNDNSKTRKN